MEIDEAIQKCIKDAQRITKGFYDDDGNWCHDPEIGDKCIQVVEWLRELQAYRKGCQCDDCIHSEKAHDEYPCYMCVSSKLWTFKGGKCR